MLTSIRGLVAATVLSACGLAAAPAWADETDPPSDFTLTGSAAIVSDYRFRGISLSGGDVAVQGSIGVSHASGLYVGAWASSIEDNPVFGHTEVDIYAGWTGEVGSGLTADVGMTYYVFPNGHVGKANIWEPYASLSTTLGPATAKVGVAYSWEQKSLGGDDNLYVYTDLGVGIPQTPISLSGHLGYTDGTLSPDRLTLKGTGGGFDYSLGATYAVTDKLSFGVSYVGVDGHAIDDYSDDTVVATLKLSF
ncbi:MAG: TorF family putative porin [Novosphingobium sp.]